MTNPKKPVSRSAKSTSVSRRVRLSQIATDSERDYCHRLGDSLKANNLADLADSLVAEGQQTPLTVYDSGRRDGDAVVYILVGGFRRFHALHNAIAGNLDVTRIHVNMEIDVTEVVRGEDQTDAEFAQDLLVRSVTENEQRKHFTTEEKLEIVKRYKTFGISEPRAASSLLMSETQYRRFVSVSKHDWLHKYVITNCIGMSSAAELIQAADKKHRVREFKEDFDAWVAQQRTRIEQERQTLAKVGKKLSTSAAQIKNRLSSKLTQHWLRCIENGHRFNNQVGLRFGIHVDSDKGMIFMPSTQLKVNELCASDFEIMIGELEDTVRKFIPMLRTCRMVEQVTDISEADIEEERRRIRDTQRKRQQEKAENEAGRPATSFHEVEEPPTETINTDDEGDDYGRFTDDETEEGTSSWSSDDGDDELNTPE